MLINVVSFPAPRPVSCRLQYELCCKRQETGRGPGNEAKLNVYLDLKATIFHWWELRNIVTCSYSLTSQTPLLQMRRGSGELSKRTLSLLQYFVT